MLVEPDDQRIEVHERLSNTAWLHRILDRESALTIVEPALTLSRADVFEIG